MSGSGRAALPAERANCKPAARTCRDGREYDGRSDAPYQAGCETILKFFIQICKARCPY